MGSRGLLNTGLHLYELYFFSSILKQLEQVKTSIVATAMGGRNGSSGIDTHSLFSPLIINEVLYEQRQKVGA
jgi:hypothetical protein